MEELPKLTKKQGLEMLIATLSMYAIIGFFIMIAIFLMTGCAHIGLPDRDHPNCSIPWEQRTTCLSGADCGEEYRCAKRGNPVGRCTYIDCCDPWRNGPRLMSGHDWCRDLKFEDDD
jgi:hypothetical protein